MEDVKQQIGSSSQPSGIVAWPLAIALIGEALSIGLALGAIGPSLPSMSKHLHTPLGSLGSLFGIQFLGSLCATALLGQWFDRYRARPMLVGGTCVVGLGLASVAAANSLAVAMAAIALAGIGGAVFAVAGPVLMSRVSGEQDGRTLSLINMAFGVGAFIGPLIAGRAVQSLHDYRPVFIWVALTVLVPLVIFLVTPLPSVRPVAGHGIQRIPPWSRLPIALLSIVGFLYLGAEIGFGGWAYSYVRATTHPSIEVASWAPACFWLALSSGSLASALRPRAVKADRLVLACGTAAGCSALVFLLAGNIALQIMAAGLTGIALGPIYPLNVATAANLIPAAAGRAASIVLLTGELGGSVLPWLQGILLSRDVALGAAQTVLLCFLLATTQGLFLRTRHASATESIEVGAVAR